MNGTIERRRGIAGFAIFTLAMVALFVGLALWQLQRRVEKHALIAEVSKAVSSALDTPVDRVRVAIYEVSTDDWGIGGVPYSAARGPVAAPPPDRDPAQEVTP